MAAYRFCRTDDIALLVDALNRCWAPSWPGEPPTTLDTFKRSIRDLQVWCSSCMVAFAGADPVGVLIGAKRPCGTLVRQIAVHPDHRRHGHGRHLLASLGSKLSILGPPRLVAEVPGSLAAARGLFSGSGYVQEAVLTDFVLQEGAREAHQAAADRNGPPSPRLRRDLAAELRAEADRFVIPVTVDDLAANGLLADADPRICWERSAETLTARKGDIAGLAVASDERIEAYVLYGTTAPAEILSLRTFVEEGGAHLQLLLGRLGARGITALRYPKVHPAEIATELLEALGFRPAGEHLLFAATARSA